ncbi:hypothetical protein [Schlesneria sp. DSM 10557]|uniref:hypothetical protein n=1 Tax=Schlesneria sp. DSM 10557 TaxID=3044399 RepID=UPI0035A051E9
MTEDSDSKIAVIRNARRRLDDAQDTGRWFQLLFSINGSGEVMSSWDGSHFPCERHGEILAYVATELQRLRDTCPCCRAKREAASEGPAVVL